MLKVGSTSPVEDFQALVADTAVSFGEGCCIAFVLHLYNYYKKDLSDIDTTDAGELCKINTKKILHGFTDSLSTVGGAMPNICQ